MDSCSSFCQCCFLCLQELLCDSWCNDDKCCLLIPVSLDKRNRRGMWRIGSCILPCVSIYNLLAACTILFDTPDGFVSHLAASFLVHLGDREA